MQKNNQQQKLTIPELQNLAITIRKHIIRMLLNAGSGHSAGSLGMTDVFTALYFNVLKHDPKNPRWEQRDRLLLSNGHICPVLYATLAEAGYFPESELKSLRQIDSRLQGHPTKNTFIGIETTSGPLGLGLSQAIGMATSFKLDQKGNRVYCLMSDGEHNEGQTWEAYLYAGARRLNNITVLIDRNNIQISGFTEDVMPLESLVDKIKSFRWSVIEVDGHNIEAIIDACNQANAIQQSPTAIICNTIPGKGVEFMENSPEWHGKPPDRKQAKNALEKLRSLRGRIWWEQ
jgi:transketolase